MKTQRDPVLRLDYKRDVIYCPVCNRSWPGFAGLSIAPSRNEATGDQPYYENDGWTMRHHCAEKATTTLASDAVTLRVMEEAANALADRALDLNDAEPEVADGLLQLFVNYDKQAAHLRSESERAYA